MCYQRNLEVLTRLPWVAVRVIQLWGKKIDIEFSSLIFRRTHISKVRTLIFRVFLQTVGWQFAMSSSLDSKCSLDHGASVVKFPPAISQFPTSPLVTFPLVSLAHICISSSQSNSNFLFLTLKHPNLSLLWRETFIQKTIMLTLCPHIAVPATLFSRHVASEHWHFYGLPYQFVSWYKDRCRYKKFYWADNLKGSLKARFVICIFVTVSFYGFCLKTRRNNSAYDAIY